MKYLIALLFACASTIAIGQINAHGTLLVVIPGTDGIILASDSRLSANNRITKSIDYYVDSINKIHILNNMPIMASGQIFLGCYSIQQIIEKYGKGEVEKDSLLFTNYVKHFRDYFPNRFPQDINTNIEFVTGFYKGGVQYTVYTQNDVIHFKPMGIYLSSKNFQEFCPRDYLTCDSIAKLLPIKIDEYKAKYQKLDIGGPISIIQIKPDNSFLWIQNNFSQQKLNLEIFYNLLKNKRMGLTKINENYIVPNTELEVQLLDCGYNLNEK